MRKKGLASIARRHGLKAVLLFGSRARGDAKPGSDFDICVSAPGRQADESRLLEDLTRFLGEDLDLCVFERIGPSLRYTVAMEGKRLYGSGDGLDRLRLRAIQEWQDSWPYLQATGAYLDGQLA